MLVMLAVKNLCSYGLMLLGLRTMVTFMTTTAALLAGVPLLMTICFLGLQIVKASWHKAHQNLSGMRQQMIFLFSQV